MPSSVRHEPGIGGCPEFATGSLLVCRADDSAWAPAFGDAIPELSADSPNLAEGVLGPLHDLPWNVTDASGG